MAERQANRKTGIRGGPKPDAVPPGGAALALAFWEGFSKPSALAFQVFCGSLLATCALCLWFFSEATLAGPMGKYLPRSGRDAEGFATHAALRAGHQTPDRPRLFLLGTSTVAQAIGSGSLLHDRILEQTGQDWEIVILATPLQSPTDQFALLDRALESQGPDSPPALVALGFGLQRLRWTPEQTLKFAAMPRLGLRSDWADAEVRALGGTPAPRHGTYIPDNLSFVLINGSEALLRLATGQPARRQVDSYAEGKPRHPRADVRDMLGVEIRAAAADPAPYFAQLDRLAARVTASPATRLVLIEEPLSPDLLADQDLIGVRGQFGRDFAASRPGSALDYWPISTEAGLTGADFHDDLHVRPGPAQQKVQAVLADHIVAMIAADLARKGAGDGG